MNQRADFPNTIIVRSRKERKSKCTVYPLKGKLDLRFMHYPVRHIPDLTGYVRLAADGPPLSMDDAEAGILLLDSNWRRALAMNQVFLDVPPRSLHGYATAFPRVSKLGTDPDNGLASVEALYLAYHILGRDTSGLLDHYQWRDEFLLKNGLVSEMSTRNN